ncbi:MAG: metallophosphoesterase family protein [Planctomycetota bacterium]
MSRRAIISDVHSNLIALEAVLADIQQQHVDGIVCLGDICGYGPQPTECIDRVRALALWTLMGNHDEALFVEPKDFGKNARLAIEWQKQVLEPGLVSTQLDEERWYWLEHLSPRRLENDVLFVHASPREPLYEYVLREDFLDTGFGPSEKAQGYFQAIKWLCFCGHSHRPGVVAEDYQWYKPEELNDYTYVLKQGGKTLINVGSVGQPRDGLTSACYCIFNLPETGGPTGAPPPGANLQSNTPAVNLNIENIGVLDETRTSDELQRARSSLILALPRVTFRRVPYDVAAAQALFRTVPELPESNALRLAQGR